MLRLFSGIFLLMLLVAGLQSCDKDQYEEIHENLVISGNQPPPFNGLSSEELNLFINKIYIDLLGRSPSSGELEEAAQAIKDAGYTEASIDELINFLQSSYAFSANLENLARQNMIASADSLYIAYYLAIYQNTVDYYYEIGDTFAAAYFDLERLSFQKLLYAGHDLHYGIIGIEDFCGRFLFNDLYDEINMGAENFVLAAFEDLLFREPTEQELFESVYMVSGVSAQLFLRDGNSKEDFVEIITHTQEFYEARIREYFLLLLARDASGQEIAALYPDFVSSSDHKELIKAIAKKEEYAGF